MDELTKRMVDTDKRGAAIHEAGHIVVSAIRDGLMLGGYIEETGTTKPDSEKTWIGQAHELNLSGGPQSAAMSVAGMAAEWLEDDPDTWAEELVETVEFDPNELSPTDAAGYPSDYADQIQAFEDALSTLRENREFFDWVVAELLTDDGVITDGMVQEYLRRNKP